MSISKIADSTAAALEAWYRSGTGSEAQLREILEPFVEATGTDALHLEDTVLDVYTAGTAGDNTFLGVLAMELAR